MIKYYNHHYKKNMQINVQAQLKIIILIVLKQVKNILKDNKNLRI